MENMKNYLLRNALCLGLLGGCFFTSLGNAAQTLYDQGYSSPEEQATLELMNRARANPAAEGVFLAGITDPNIVGTYVAYGIDTAQLIADFQGYSAMPPLAFNGNLAVVARQHSHYMAINRVYWG